MAKEPHRKTARQQRIEQKRAEKRRSQFISIAIIVVLLGVAGFTVFNHFGQPKAAPVSEARLADYPAKGPADAPVVITEFSDFGCPSCQQWHRLGLSEQILQQFGDQVRIEWRDYPVISPPYSVRAAQAGQCAHDQGLFWEYHDVTFERQSFSALRDDDLRLYAQQAGADMDQFNQCFDSNQHRQTVGLNEQAARNLGFRGAPSFVINGQPLSGPNFEMIISIIETQLAASQ